MEIGGIEVKFEVLYSAEQEIYAARIPNVGITVCGITQEEALGKCEEAALQIFSQFDKAGRGEEWLVQLALPNPFSTKYYEGWERID